MLKKAMPTNSNLAALAFVLAIIAGCSAPAAEMRKEVSSAT